MGIENDAVYGQTSIDINLAPRCAETCSPDAIEARLDGMVSYVVADYTMNRVMFPGAEDMPTTVTVEATANCVGGKRNLIGRFKCALETTCELNAVSERREEPTDS